MRLIFHIGSQKAGSTSIQRSLADNASLLENYGYCYPLPADEVSIGPGWYNHSPIFKYFFQGLNRVSVEDSVSELFLGSILDKMLDDGIHTIILSSEHFFRVIKKPELFSDFFSKFSSVLVVAYIRSPEERYLSRTLQKIKHSEFLISSVVDSSFDVLKSYQGVAEAFPIKYDKDNFWETWFQTSIARCCAIFQKVKW